MGVAVDGEVDLVVEAFSALHPTTMPMTSVAQANPMSVRT
jgi:hypothetical protein